MPATPTHPQPSRETVRQVLAAAADVLFADGVSPEFLDRWAEETVLLLDLTATRDARWGAALAAGDHAGGGTASNSTIERPSGRKPIRS